MRIAGIIAEYDPFTNGHAFHLEQTLREGRADFVVAVMSGDFTQRGRPALLDKWTRSRLAVENGVDLVLELPFCYATAGAEVFARGAVGVLEGLGVVDALGFGSESGDIDELMFIAGFLKNEPDEYKRAIKRHLDMGISFPKAREMAVNECLGMEAGKLLKSPNNILAIEYLKHVVSMTPVTVKRESPYGAKELPAAGDGCGTGLASAGAVRNAVRSGDIGRTCGFVPRNVYETIVSVYGEGDLSKEMEDRYFDLLRTVILRNSAEELAGIYGAIEGIENRMKKEIRMHADVDAYASSLKSKRFTRTAIDRLMLHTLLGLRKEDAAAAQPYARVLAMSEGGEKILAAARGTASIPVVTNINKYAGLPDVSRFDVLASDMYNVLSGCDLYEESDHVRRPYRFDG
ncbi:MAG: nucleotidyltransferase family protein [Firmicutes bacterium]|nr:nucleotidyltransferase family protein [Bacillota bacterium]